MANRVAIGSRGRRLGVAVAAVALVPVVAQAWVSGLLPASEPAPTAAQQLRAVAPAAAGNGGLAEAQRAGIDVNKVIDTVRHNVAPVPGRPAILEARDDAYHATFDAAGFGLTLGHGALGVSFREATRGDQALALRTGPWQGDANVARRVLGPGLHEHVSARDRELEWDVVLDAPPPGRGPLRVEADLTGARSATRLKHAWRFTLDGGVRVRMGELVVKDATGAELYRSLPAVTGTHLALEVPDSVLTRASYPLTIDPTVGPELPVTGPLAAPGPQNFSSLAFDGTNYLVVWQDFTVNIRGTRVSPAGTVLDPQGITISTAADEQSAPVVAFDGTNYLVAWADARTDANDIYAARISTAGALLDGPPATGGIAISTAANAQSAPAVAFDGTNYLLTWTDGRAGTSDIFGARVSPAGTLLDGPPDTGGIVVSTAANNQSAPALAFDGTNYLVVWTDARASNNDIFGARVSTSGSVLDGPPATGGIAVSTAVKSQQFPAVAFDGTNYLVTWADLRAGNNDIFGARVSTAGSLLDGPSATGGIAISTAASAQQLPALAFDGTNYLVVWRDLRSGSFDIFGARVSTAGALLDGPPATGGIAISTAVNSQQFPAVAFDGTNYLVAWGDDRSATDDIFGARLSTSAALVDGPPATGGLLLSTGPARQTLPAVAFDGTNYFVVWSDFRSGEVDDFSFEYPDLFGARVSPTGAILDPTGIVIDSETFAGTVTFRGAGPGPAVAFDGTNYFVVWGGGYRVSTAGVVLDPDPIQIFEFGGTSDVVFDGTNYFVVGQQSSNEIVGARVSTSGTVLDPSPIAIGRGGFIFPNKGPSVSFDGTNYLIVWFRTISTGQYDIYGARVSSGGTLLDGPPDETGGIAISTAPNIQTNPSVAFDGTRYLVAWSDARGSGATFAARLSTTGSLLDGPPDTGGIPIGAGGGPSVAANGPFLVVWNRAGEIVGARVNGSDGTVTDPSGFVIAPSGSLSSAITRPGGWAVSYSGLDSTYGANRVFLRTVAPK